MLPEHLTFFDDPLVDHYREVGHKLQQLIWPAHLLVLFGVAPRILQVDLPMPSASILDPKGIPSIIKFAQTAFLEQMRTLEKSL